MTSQMMKGHHYLDKFQKLTVNALCLKCNKRNDQQMQACVMPLLQRVDPEHPHPHQQTHKQCKTNQSKDQCKSMATVDGGFMR